MFSMKDRYLFMLLFLDYMYIECKYKRNCANVLASADAYIIRQ